MDTSDDADSPSGWHQPFRVLQVLLVAGLLVLAGVGIGRFTRATPTSSPEAAPTPSEASVSPSSSSSPRSLEVFADLGATVYGHRLTLKAQYFGSTTPTPQASKPAPGVPFPRLILKTCGLKPILPAPTSFFAFTVALTNRTGQPVSFSRSRFALIDNVGAFATPSDPSGFPPSATFQKTGVIPPGATLNGYLFFPAGLEPSPTKLSYSDARQTLSILLC